MKHHIFCTTKAIIFDFDGTLAVLNIDFSSMQDRIFELIERYDIDQEKIQEKYLLEIIEEICMILYKNNPSDAETFYKEAHQILHGLEMKAAEAGKLISGVKATLRRLRDKGVKIGIITRNCEEAVRKVFPEIDHYCDVFVSRNSVRHVKPHPEHLVQVIESLKTSAKESIMVGDHVIDIQAGKRLGMRTIGVLTGRTKRKEFKKAGADYVLKNVSEVYGCLGDKKEG